MRAIGACGIAAQSAWKRLILGALCRCTPKGLAKIRGFGEARSRQTNRAFGQPDYADPPPRRVLRFYGFGVAASRKRDSHAADSAHSASLPDYRQLINPT